MESRTPYLPISSNSSWSIAEALVSTESTDTGQTDMSGLLRGLPDNAGIGRDGFSKEVALLLSGMGMEKYIQLFQGEDLNLETLLNLTRADLEQLGIEDARDRDLISQQVNLYKGKEDNKVAKPFKVLPNSHEDVIIARNILKHIVMLENFASYSLIKIKKTKLVDHFMSNEKTAIQIIKLLAEKASTQAQHMNSMLYTPAQPCLISTVMQLGHMSQPANLESTNRNTRKRHQVKGKIFVLKAMVIVGVSSAIVLLGKFMLHKE